MVPAYGLFQAGSRPTVGIMALLRHRPRRRLDPWHVYCGHCEHSASALFEC